MATKHLHQEDMEFNNNNNSINKVPQENGHVVVDNFLANGVKPFSGRLGGMRRRDLFRTRSKSSHSLELKDVENAGTDTTGNGITGDRFVRVKSARQSKKLDTTGINQGQGPLGACAPEKADSSEHTSQEPHPGTAFQDELGELVNEITTKVLIDKPENINLFIAEYLEDKIKRERQKVVDPRSKLKRQGSRVGKMLFRQATLLARMSSGFGSLRESLRHQNDPEAAQKMYFHIPEEKELKVVELHKNAVTQCTFFNHHVISSSLDSKICVFNAENGEKVSSVANHKPIHCFALYPIDTTKLLLLAGADDGQVAIWKVRFGSKVTVKLKVLIPMHQPNPIRAICLSPHHEYLATGCCFVMNQISPWGYTEPSVRGTLKTWNLKHVINYALKPKEFYDDINHEGMKTYKQIIARTEALQKKMSSYTKLTDGHEDETFYGIRCLLFTPDGSKIIVGFGHPTETGLQDTKMMAVVDYKSMETLWLQYGAFYQLNAMAFDQTCIHGKTWPWTFLVSTDCHLYLATLVLKDESGDKSKIKIKFPWRLDFTKGDHQGGTFSPDGSAVATGSGKYLLLFESSNGSQLATYSGHKHNITHVAYSQDGKYICTASRDRTIRVWKAPTRSTDPPKGKVIPIPVETKVKVDLSPDLSSPDDVISDQQSQNETETTSNPSTSTQDSPASSSEPGKGLTSLFGQKKSRFSGLLASVKEQRGEKDAGSETKES